MSDVAPSVGFWAWAGHAPERIALIDPDGREISYQGLHARCNRLANALQSLGLRKGDGIALFLANTPEFYEIAQAALQIGLCFTPINHYLAAPEMSYMVGDCQAKALFADARYGEKVAAALAQTPCRRSAAS